MQLLSKLSCIVVGGAYPYEIKLASYYSAAFSILAADTDRTNSTDPDTMFWGKHRYLIGANPYTRPGYHNAANPQLVEAFFAQTAPAILGRCFRDLMTGYYEMVKKDQDKPDACYFAEKSTLDDVARKGPRLFFDKVREIILVRDPRDLVCSAKAFWKMSSSEAIELVSNSSIQLHQIHSSADPDTLLLRYEDLVASPHQAIEHITGFLGVAPVALPDISDSNLFSVHATSSSPTASIGRWRQDLSEQEIKSLEERTRAFLQVFGYSIS
jgi:hypothetical protein